MTHSRRISYVMMAACFSIFKNPMWLTLIGLVVGEKLTGIPGMVLAPVVLHYIKVEASGNKIADPQPALAPAGAVI